MSDNKITEIENPIQSELANKIDKLLDEYPDMSIATQVGILQYIAIDLISRDLKNDIS